MRARYLWTMVLLAGLLCSVTAQAYDCGMILGDRVKLVVNHPGGNPTLHYGHLGTVICLDPDDASMPVLVSWDAWVGGHENVGFCHGTVLPHLSHSCWWMTCSQIERLRQGVPDILDGGEQDRSFKPQTLIAGKANQALEVSFNVVNGGTGNPEEPIYVDVYASSDTTITRSDYYLGSVNCYISAGGSLQKTLKTTLPTKIPAGFYYIGWIMDPMDLIPDEYDETNNTACVGSYRLLVTGAAGTPCLELSAASGGKITTPGEGVYVYPSTRQVSVAASADAGCYFAGWIGTAVDAGKVIDPKVASTQVTVDAKYSLQAVFDGAHMVLDDFEDYNDASPVSATWVDGLGWHTGDPQGHRGNGTGALIGNAEEPTPGNPTVHGGTQAMAFYYDNSRSPYYSEASRRWGAMQNWSATGADKLSIWYRGAAGNAPQTLYVVVEDHHGGTAVMRHSNSLAVQNGQWSEWTIPLRDIQAAGVMLSRVVKVGLGVGDRANPLIDGAGLLYFDDIALVHSGSGGPPPGGQPPEVPAVDSPIAHWKLDEASGTIADDCAGGHDGRLYGGPTWQPTGGVLSGALRFDGIDDYVDTGHMDNLANWTVSAWVKSPAAPSTPLSSGPVHRERNYQFNWNHNDWSFRGAAALAVGGNWYPASFGALDADRWYHLAATYDGDALRAYKDGVLITTNTAPSGTPDYEPASLKLGRHATWSGQCFAGTVDDVRIYDQALSGSDIHSLAGAAGPGPRR